MSPDEINQINESVIQMINFQETDQWLHVDFGFKGKVYSSFYCKEKAKTYLTNANAIQKIRKNSVSGGQDKLIKTPS